MAEQITQQQAGAAEKRKQILYWIGFVVASSIISFSGTLVFILLTEKPPLTDPNEMGAVQDSLFAEADSLQYEIHHDSLIAGGDSISADSSRKPEQMIVNGTIVDAESAQDAGPVIASNYGGTETAEETTEEKSPKPDYKQLAKIYSQMDARAAAQILERLDDAMVVGILQEMRDRNAAELLTVIEPDRAAIISEALTKIQKLN